MKLAFFPPHSISHLRAKNSAWEWLVLYFEQLLGQGPTLLQKGFPSFLSLHCIHNEVTKTIRYTVQYRGFSHTGGSATADSPICGLQHLFFIFKFKKTNVIFLQVCIYTTSGTSTYNLKMQLSFFPTYKTCLVTLFTFQQFHDNNVQNHIDHEEICQRLRA